MPYFGCAYSGKEVYLEAGRPAPKAYSPKRRRLLRDRALLLLRRAGMSLGQIAIVSESFSSEPCRDRAHILRRIRCAESEAAWEATRKGLRVARPRRRDAGA